MLRLNKRLYLANTSETQVLLILLCRGSAIRKTIRSPDNKAYVLASLNNSKIETIARENNNGLY